MSQKLPYFRLIPSLLPRGRLLPIDQDLSCLSPEVVWLWSRVRVDRTNENCRKFSRSNSTFASPLSEYLSNVSGKSCRSLTLETCSFS